ncbi:hypothetical protein [Paenibacillus sp. 1781tsa1]|uniref:hypothetical protein n=1 Tax=Paenibacillus sp. 1781tsa1 TaxID=2953810 RepID=UPI00209CE700|nr:hypothetical protein [Paenibacillus sp. 1781tsa1]MCP1187567.1 hypothetical protein [Paenibacillus sp. 1781tsa1]
MIGNIIDSILDWLTTMAKAVLLLLPESPFASLKLATMPGFADVMGWINYFVPIGPMLTLLTSYLGCVAIWYGVRWVLRLAQYID